MEQRVVRHTVQRTTQHTETLSDMMATERWDRQKGGKAAVEEARCEFETKLAAFEQRIVQHADQRIIQHIDQYSERTHPLSDAIAKESWNRQKKIKDAVEEVREAIETEQAMKLKELAERLQAVPGQTASSKNLADAERRQLQSALAFTIGFDTSWVATKGSPAASSTTRVLAPYHAN